MLQGLWQHCSTIPRSTIPRFTIISIWSFKAYSATSLSPPAAAPPAFGGRKPDGKKHVNESPKRYCFFYSRATVCWFFRRQSHPAAGPRLSWGCRRSLGPHRPGRGRPPGGSRTGAEEAPQPGSPAAIRWVRRAERPTGATEPPCWRRAEHKHSETSCIWWESAKFRCG